MKRTALAGLVMLLAVGCNQSQPVGSPATSSASPATPTADVSVPDKPADSQPAEVADEQLVSLKIPGMT